MMLGILDDLMICLFSPFNFRMKRDTHTLPNVPNILYKKFMIFFAIPCRRSQNKVCSLLWKGQNVVLSNTWLIVSGKSMTSLFLMSVSHASWNRAHVGSFTLRQGIKGGFLRMPWDKNIFNYPQQQTTTTKMMVKTMGSLLALAIVLSW